MALRASVLVLCLWAAASKPAGAGLEDEAADFVADRGGLLVEILDLPHGGDRRERFAAWLVESFDLDVMARLALGPYRKLATEEQIDAFRASFSDFIVAAFEARFDAFAGYGFEVARARPLGDDAAVVRADIVAPEGGDRVADFRVRRDGDGRLRIVDVAVEGLSMLKTQRDEFGAVVRRDGFDGLIESLNARAGELVAGGG